MISSSRSDRLVSMISSQYLSGFGNHAELVVQRFRPLLELVLVFQARIEPLKVGLVPEHVGFLRHFDWSRHPVAEPKARCQCAAGLRGGLPSASGRSAPVPRANGSVVSNTVANLAAHCRASTTLFASASPIRISRSGERLCRQIGPPGGIWSSFSGASSMMAISFVPPCERPPSCAIAGREGIHPPPLQFRPIKTTTP